MNSEMKEFQVTLLLLFEFMINLIEFQVYLIIINRSIEFADYCRWEINEFGNSATEERLESQWFRNK